MSDMTTQNAIYCMKAMICEEVCEECDYYGKTGTDHCEADAVRMAIKALEEQPHWIPCSERLPEEFGEYLVTKKAIGWNCEEYNSNDIAYFDNEGFHKADKVLAWMPLPEGYKGE